MGIFNVIFQRKNKKALWFPVFLGQGTTFVSVVFKGFYFQYSNFELYSYFSSSEQGLQTKFQHTSIEATCNTRTLFRNKQKLSLSIPVTVRSMQITKKKHKKKKHHALSNIFEETMAKFKPCSFTDLIPFFSPMYIDKHQVLFFSFPHSVFQTFGQVVCIQPSPPLKLNQRETLPLHDFFRGGGGCTQAMARCQDSLQFW